MADGLDVYTAYQQVTDWAAVRRAGYEFCYVKVSDGDKDRPDDGYGFAGRAAGVAMGAYHYAEPGDPVAQADRLVNRATAAGLLDLAPALDLESPFMPGSAAVAFAVAFVRRVRDRGHRPALYGNNSMLQAVRAPVLAAVPETLIWAARYGASPTLPYDVWQWSDAGHVPGISGTVDLSRGAVPYNTRPPAKPAASTPTRKDEGVYKTFQPGTHVQDLMDVAGCSKLRVLTGWGHNVTIHRLVFVGDTDYSKNPKPGDTGGSYDKGYDGPDWTFVPDRPGPFDIPQAPVPAVQCSIEYSADHAFDLSAH